MVALIDALFWFSSLYILPFWLMMWFAPTHERTAALMRSEWVYLAPLAVAYTIAVLPNLLDIFIQLGSDMPTPDIVVGLFSEREVILIGWLHYLAFRPVRWAMDLAAIGGYRAANLRLDARPSVLDDGGAARCAAWDAGHPGLQRRQGQLGSCGCLTEKVSLTDALLLIHERS